MTYEQPKMQIIMIYDKDIVCSSIVVPGTGIPDLDEEDWEKEQ